MSYKGLQVKPVAGRADAAATIPPLRTSRLDVLKKDISDGLALSGSLA
jgi:hypothetical protein